jgi:hypothetical protein
VGACRGSRRSWWRVNQLVTIGGCLTRSPRNGDCRWCACSHCWCGRALETEDLTLNKSNLKDAMLIARQAGERRCYEPERINESMPSGQGFVTWVLAGPH